MASAIFRPAAAPNGSNCPTCLSEFNEGEIVLAHIAPNGANVPIDLTEEVPPNRGGFLGTNIMPGVPRHYFHQGCLVTWIRERALVNPGPGCPTCRVPINLGAGVLGYDPPHPLRWEALKARIKTFLCVAGPTFGFKIVTIFLARAFRREIIEPLCSTTEQNLVNLFALLNANSNTTLKTVQIIAAVAANLLMHLGVCSVLGGLQGMLYVAFACTQIFIGLKMRWGNLNEIAHNLSLTDVYRLGIFAFGAMALDIITESFSVPWILTANVVYACATGLIEACLTGLNHL